MLPRWRARGPSIAVIDVPDQRFGVSTLEVLVDRDDRIRSFDLKVQDFAMWLKLR